MLNLKFVCLTSSHFTRISCILFVLNLSLLLLSILWIWRVLHEESSLVHDLVDFFTVRLVCGVRFVYLLVK
jgi:hypothetical protein